MRLALTFIISSLFLLAVAVLYDVNYINYESPRPYAEWTKINFYDFRGLKKPGMKLQGIAEFAYIKTNRRIDYLSNGNVEITTYFYRSKSYVFAQDIRNPDLLRHELYHFHITEYFSRLLRRTIVQSRNQITRKTIRNLNWQYYTLEDQMQQQYDEDSDHSYVLQEQRRWEIKVDSLLYSLHEFSTPVVAIGNKEYNTLYLKKRPDEKILPAYFFNHLLHTYKLWW